MRTGAALSARRESGALGADPAALDPGDCGTADGSAMLFASALFLASGYARGSRSGSLGRMVSRHLECLAERDDVPPVVRELCEQLAVEWQELAREQRDAPAPPRRPGLFAITRLRRLSRARTIA